ncbi:MAG: M35 family metallo-endopeptidase [Myxococcota bacterium]
MSTRHSMFSKLTPALLTGLLVGGGLLGAGLMVQSEPVQAYSGMVQPGPGQRDESLRADVKLVPSAQGLRADLTLTNVSRQPLKLVSWYVPGPELEDDLFLVDINGEPAAYLGAHYKRSAVTERELLTLLPGQSLHRSVALEKYYDLSEAGTVSVRFEVEALKLKGLSTSQLDRSYGRVLSSEPVSVSSQGWAYVPPADKLPDAQDAVQAGTLSYSKCSTSQQSTVKSAYSAAITYANESSSYLTSTSPSGTARYTTWFGTFSLNNWNTATTHFKAIQDAYNNKAVVIDCSCKKAGVYAYVYPSSPYKIYVCSAFWNAPMTGTDSKGGTLIHEMSHFTVVAGTDDWAYGQTDAKALAKSDPTKALDNADNHEYFAENNPKQN